MKKIYIILMFLVVFISGNPAIEVLSKEVAYIGSLFIFLFFWWRRPLSLNNNDRLVFVIFFILIMVHVLNFGAIVINASLGFMVNLSIAMLAIKLIPRFSYNYVGLMYFLALISFLFWVPLLFGVDMQGFFSAIRIPINSDVHYHIGFYNLREEYDGSVRNMGMFWEPGAFAGYLILALFLLMRGGNFNAVWSKKGLVLISALLSTKSTTGYIAFMLLAVFYAYNSALIKGKFVKLIFLPIFFFTTVGVSYVATNELSFLGEKIEDQLKSASVRDDSSKINRFGNFLYDLEWIDKRPLLGWSANPATRFSIDGDAAELVNGQGNGLTGFAVKFGLIGLLIFIGFAARTIYRITGSVTDSFFGVAIVCVLLNGEQFLNFPMFLSLLFVPYENIRLINGRRIADVQGLGKSQR